MTDNMRASLDRVVQKTTLARPTITPPNCKCLNKDDEQYESKGYNELVLSNFWEIKRFLK